MGDTRRVVDGEERSVVRPLRPAVPPEGVAGRPPVPRPRPAEEPARAATAATAEAAPSDTKPADPNGAPATSDTGGNADRGDAAVEAMAAGGRRRRAPFAHALRTPPRQLAVRAARAGRDWSRRPSGRTTLPGLFLLALVAAAAVAGVLVVPAAVREPQPVAADATAGLPVGGVPEGGATPGATVGPSGLPTGSPLPGGAVPTEPVPGVLPSGRPADALADWAQGISRTTGIPVVALQAYGYAELVLAQTHRGCHLTWTTLAAIGYVESRHGSANGATLQPNGVSEPEILGDPLDGQGGRLRVLDTDQGRLDHDTVHDRALGPMQFIPSTWQQVGADADNDDVRNPHDIDDAALAAGEYLCTGGRNLTIPGDWWGAILSYNDVRRYAQAVFDKANEYGRLSGT